MKESIQYGIPGGLFLFALLLVQLKFEMYEMTVLRWILAISITQLVSMLALKAKTAGKLDFRIAWFGGFNILFVTVIFYVLLGFLLARFISTLGSNQLEWNLHVAILEFFGLMTIGVLVTTLLSYVYKRKD